MWHKSLHRTTRHTLALGDPDRQCFLHMSNAGVDFMEHFEGEVKVYVVCPTGLEHSTCSGNYR